jgi:DNA (cytosine-5)-methyltransferase 1
MAISDLLGDLVAAEPDGFMTELPELSVENRRRIDFLHDQDLYDLPDEHRNKKARESGTTYRSVYGRMYWDKPAQTITTGFLTPGRGRYVHPIARRTLLPLEAARLQGFPDDYVFNAFGETPNRTALAKWIGDAVPAPLGFAAAISALARKV